MYTSQTQIYYVSPTAYSSQFDVQTKFAGNFAGTDFGVFYAKKIKIGYTPITKIEN